MLDPYRMIVVNCIAIISLFIGIVIYKFIYPKKNINLLVVVVLLSSILSISIFRKGIYESGDFTIHLYRTISFYHSLAEGHFLPSWASELNATYGYPLFIFNYTLPYYLLGFIHWLGFSFISSMKIFLSLNIILSGVFMYELSKRIFKNDLAAFTSSVFYLFSPYHLVDVHFKIVIGEIIFFTLLPLYFLFLERLLEKKKVHILTTGFALSLLIMSHIVIALFVIFLSGAYCIYKIYKKRSRTSYCIYFLTSVVLGGLSTVYIWLPPFILTKFTIYQKAIENHVLSLPVTDLLYSPWRFGFLFQGPYGEISNLIGYSQLIILLILLWLVLQKKISKKYISDVRFWLITTVVLLFLITPYADFFWYAVPFIRNVGNHRLLLIVAFTFSVLAGYLSLINKRKYLLYMFIIFTIVSTILNWGQRRVIPFITDKDIQKSLPQSTARGEGHYYANSLWADQNHPWREIPPNEQLTVISGSVTVKNVKRNSTSHTYVINSKSTATLQDNTLYFPGWSVKVDGKKVKIDYETNSLIKFNVQRGLHYVEVSYEDIELYKISKYISVIVFFGILFLLFFAYFKKAKIFMIK